MKASALEYLDLLRVNDSKQALDKFLSLAEQETGITTEKTGSPITQVQFEDLLKVGDEADQETVAFLQSWLAKFRQSASVKTDSLTGLLTRDYWNRVLKDELEEVVRNSTVMMLDIDHFKAINDTYGHQIGDQVLELIGNIITQCVDPDDFAIRYGGEEFLVILRCGRRDATEQAKTLLRETRGSRFFEEQSDSITLSLGLSLPREDSAPSIEERIEEADLALYESKHAGRDQFKVFAPYMRHRQRLSIWGFYRYLWNTDVRFSFSPGGDSFLLYGQDSLLEYCWYENTSSPVPVLDHFALPIQNLTPSERGWWILDTDGELRHVNEQFETNRITGQDAPRLVAVSGHNSTAMAVGVNNQIYEVSEGGLSRRGSLPESWDRLLYNGRVYIVREDTLLEWSETGTRRISALPSGFRDFAVSSDRLVMSGTKGNLYQFNCELEQWNELKIPDLFNKTVRVGNVSVHRQNYLFKDDLGRLIFARRDSKSVPQEMNL
ncbi:MAG: GGDEF domain-containing protein [bacterium]